jgi:hypothetical protein
VRESIDEVEEGSGEEVHQVEGANIFRTRAGNQLHLPNRGPEEMGTAAWADLARGKSWQTAGPWRECARFGGFAKDEVLPSFQ